MLVVSHLVVMLGLLAAAAVQPPRVNADAKALAEFRDELEDFVELHQRLDKDLPQPAREATPEAIDVYRRAHERQLQRARRGEDQGEIFTREARRVIRRLLHEIFKAPDGASLRAAIMDENPPQLTSLRVNSRYPDDAPLSTVPPQVLKALPPVPDVLEYRFIGDRLLLLDTHVPVVIDILPAAIPK